jgi:hypothetical protein
MFKTEIKSQKTLGKSKEIILKITRKDAKIMNPKEVKTLVNELITGGEEKYENFKIRVRVLTPVQWFTVKGFSDPELRLEDVEEYLDGKVHETKHLGSFYQLEVSMIRDV